jgi:uroporphyrinogen decarboxylase
MFNYLNSKTNAKIFFHSCGAIRSVIPDLIEAGVDIINPVQVGATGMDSAELKREFGKDLTFWVEGSILKVHLTTNIHHRRYGQMCAGG